MNKKLTTKEFIEKAKLVHGDKYDYSNVIYEKSIIKVDIKCNLCGIYFSQTPNSHISGIGCSNCAGNKKLTTALFIQKAKIIHNDNFDYNQVIYINNNTKIKIICNTCKLIFEQTPNHHLNGNKCPNYCGIRLNHKTFIEKSKLIHNNNFNYDLVDYVNMNIKVKILCNKCQNIFSQKPIKHINGNGCLKCSNINKTHKTDDFIIYSKLIHNNDYDYNLVNYINSSIKVEIKCNKCQNIFSQLPSHHKSGHGCPKCTISSNEKVILKFLQENKINYISQHKFIDCKNKKLLPFDFYLPDQNVLIEFDGKQHFEPIKWFGGEKTFNNLKINDNIKNQYAFDSKIELIRIRYDENIIDILNNRFIL